MNVVIYMYVYCYRKILLLVLLYRERHFSQWLKIDIDGIDNITWITKIGIKGKQIVSNVNTFETVPKGLNQNWIHIGLFAGSYFVVRRTFETGYIV